MNISLLRHAFVLILLSLIGGFLIPVMAIPRLGLSAHTIGVVSGALLIGIGAIWQHFRLSQRQLQVLRISWLYSSYANWFGCLLGGLLGAGRMTPLAAAGVTGAEYAETAVRLLLVTVGVASLVAAGLSLWGLRAAQPPSA